MTKKTESNSTEGMLNRIFNMVGRKVDNVVWDLSTAALGILEDDEGVYTLNKSVDADNKPVFDYVLNPMDVFSMKIPAFAIRTLLDKVEIGDIIVTNNKNSGFVTEVDLKKQRVRVLRKNGNNGWINPPTVSMLSGKGVLVVKNLMNAADNQLLMALMLMGDDFGEDTMGKMIAMSMFSGDTNLFNMGGGADNPMGNLLPLMLMRRGDDGKGGDDLVKMMLMQSMMGGAGDKGINPLVLLMMSKSF